jgi:hypothetical protein
MGFEPFLVCCTEREKRNEAESVGSMGVVEPPPPVSPFFFFLSFFFELFKKKIKIQLGGHIITDDMATCVKCQFLIGPRISSLSQLTVN